MLRRLGRWLRRERWRKIAGHRQIDRLIREQRRAGRGRRLPVRATAGVHGGDRQTRTTRI